MCSVLACRDGYQHNWHFDESQWSTTLLLQVRYQQTGRFSEWAVQEAQQGGDFCYTPPFRREEEVAETAELAGAVVAGQPGTASTLAFHPGTLSIFQVGGEQG